MKSNDALRNLYDHAYKDGTSYAGGKNSFFTFSTSDVTDFILKNVDFKNKAVLEVGCGTGETAFAVARSGADAVHAIDYSEEAIKTCQAKYRHSGLVYKAQNYRDIHAKFDIVLLQEVIEHLDDPESTIVELMEKVQDKGLLVLTCPNFTNIRGYIWMTLQILFNVPMSLSDIHFFSPFDFEDIAQKHNFNLQWTTFAHDRVQGEKLIHDMTKRLKNALRDAGMDNSKVEELMSWVEKVTKIDNQPSRINGGKGFYVFSRR